MKKVIVTGANGFLGAAVCNELLRREVKVIAVVKNSESDLSRIDKSEHLKIVCCDIADYRKLSNLIQERDIDVIYHFAWIGTSGELRGNYDVQIKNIQYTCELVKACKKLSCKKFIFAASIMEYEVEKIMHAENVPNINTLYCTSKLCADYMAKTLCGNLGIEYIRCIISNVYGAGEKSPRFVNTSIRKMLNGEHCAFSSGEQLYDFIYVTDAAIMFVMLGEKSVSNRTYYIGNQEQKPLKDYINELRDCVNPNLEIGIGELTSSGISLQYNEFDVNAIERETGYIPQIAFNEGIKKTIKWIMENG